MRGRPQRGGGGGVLLGFQVTGMIEGFFSGGGGGG